MNREIATFGKKGQVLCFTCSDWQIEDPEPVRIYEINIRPYKQTCHKCHKVVYEGTINVILFADPCEQLPRMRGTK